MMINKTQIRSQLGLRLLQSFALLVLLHSQAQAQAVVNVAGSTTKASVVVASDEGGVSTAMLPNSPMRQVALNIYEPAFLQSGPLQPLYSRLIPITGRHGLNRHARINKINAQILKQISQVYLKVQSEHGGMVVDVLPILVRGEKPPASGKPQRSDVFAQFIAQQLVNNGVKNVRLNHVPQGDVITRDPTQRSS
jgi:hypothetical protein